MPKDIKFNIRLSVDGKDQLVTASVNLKELSRQMDLARSSSGRMRDELLMITQTGAAIQNTVSGMRQLVGVVSSYSAANRVQVEAETKLANNMRNTMGAREEEIQSIKDLCSAQQELGVIGDEVQLAGAQELATYLEKKSSLEKLIPVMNDMVAQQYGFNATQESAANIATMLGKVMDGQTGALSRYGYKFDEAQEQILKFGTEEERAAVLAEVVESAVGGMNAELAKTDAGKAVQMANAIGDLKEQMGALFERIEPAVVAAGELGMAFMAVGTTYNGIKGLVVGLTGLSKAVNMATVSTYGHAAASKVSAAAQRLWSAQLYYGRQAALAWTFGAKLATVQAVAMRAAIMGLMAVTGVGLAFMAVSSVLSLFAGKTDDAAESMRKANREARLAEEEGKRLKDVEQAAADAYTNSSSALEINKEKLRSLIAVKNTGKDTSREEKEIVGQLNDTYGETMGYFGSVAKWYEALVQNSEAYCRQMVVEARTRQLANQIAEKEAETRGLIYDDKGNKRKYSTKRDSRQVASGQIDAGDGKLLPIYETQEIIGTSEIEKINRQVKDNRAVVADLQRQMRDAVAEAGRIEFKVKGSASRPGGGVPGGGSGSGGGGKKEELKLVADAGTYKELKNNVAYYQQELEKADITDTEHIVTLARSKKAAEDAVAAFMDLAEAANVPAELNSLEDYDKKLGHLRKQRMTANKEALAGIDAEIERTEAARQALEDERVAALKDDEIRSYEQLNQKLAYYNRLLDSGDEQQRLFAQKGINALNKLKGAWDLAVDEARLPETTDTAEDIDAAISFYSERQQREDADQIQKTQAVIDELTAKKKVLQIGIELSGMRKEMAEVEGLEGREFRVKVRGMGFEALTEKIRELNGLLSDMEHPVTESQRKEIEGMIATYERWRRTAVLSMDTFKNGWNGVKGVDGGIRGITEALEGNSTAWEKAMAVVDGFIALYDGIQAIVGVVRMLTVATGADTVAHSSDAAAAASAAAAKGADAAASGTAAAASVPLIAANKAATASFVELASASYYAAHAFIPFAGFGIASGFSAAAASAVKAVGLMPFAKGGIVSGPTVALVGEYAGAGNNPEVIAPLDRLRGLLADSGGGGGGEVEFRIKGRTLVGILEREREVSRRG
ncbi:MAG: hypothetical protein ACI3YD_00600 [Alloprevotella sp.]